eukprot:TRINITY_DN6000_c0_g1_i19.p1 TRINITY_DN6000_c0_g1~~TRINITY_DN6000_c0_g1_i19.p1  ORF type:complete len:1006 (-),score=192.55 TRINITY_DN6000_c0_g1_i19:743-3760(-)
MVIAIGFLVRMRRLHIKFSRLPLLKIKTFWELVFRPIEFTTMPGGRIGNLLVGKEYRGVVFRFFFSSFRRFRVQFFSNSGAFEYKFFFFLRLVQAGYKVGIVNQTETAALKAIGNNKGKPMTRALTQVLSRSTLIGQELDPILVKTEGGEGEEDVSRVVELGSMGHYLMSIYEEPGGGNSKGNRMSARTKCNTTTTTTTNVTATEKDESPVVNIFIVAVQTSTGDIIYDSFQDGFMRKELETRLYHISPIELLLPPTLSRQTEKLIRSFNPHKEGISIERFEKYHLLDADQVIQETLSVGGGGGGNRGGGGRSLKKKNLEEMDDEDEDQDDEDEVIKGKQKANEILSSFPDGLRRTFGNVMHYLTRFSLQSLFFLECNYQHCISRMYMKLDSSSLKNLEIFENHATKFGKGTLFWVMNYAKTMMGKRMLIDWMRRPLLDKTAIEERLEAVSELLLGSSDELQQFLLAFQGVVDLERAICRLYYKKCSLFEFILVLKTFQLLQSVVPSTRDLTSQLLIRLIQEIPDIKSDLDYFFDSLTPSALSIDSSTSILQSEMFTQEAFPALTKQKKVISTIEQQLQEHLKDIRKILDIPSLQYKTVSNIEYLVEVKGTQSKHVPNNWILISGTKTLTRYHTPLIKELIPKLVLARECVALEAKHAWDSFLGQFAAKYEKFRKFVNVISVLDVLSSFSTLASREGYCKPSILSLEQPQQIRMVSGRHPIIEALLDTPCVPNTLNMCANVDSRNREAHGEQTHTKAIILTGPNMGGKTSISRQIALLVIMAQMGCYVPAEEFTLSILDGIYTRMGAHDDVMRGQSTFFVELMETSRLLAHSTDRSLVILDELGRGTSTHDGVAIAYATLEYLVSRVSAFTIFVSHYPTLARLVDKYPNHLSSFHMSFVQETEQKIAFLYQLVAGVEQRSYGLNVASLANIPKKIIERAAHFSGLLEKVVIERQSDHIFCQLFGLVLKMQTSEEITRTRLTFKSLQDDLIYCQKAKKQIITKDDH